MQARARIRAGTFRAFTLIELLVVVSIIALLISILLPAMSRAREQARIVKCLSNLRQIATAMTSYFVDNGNWFPFEKYNIDLANPVHGFYYGGHPGRPGWWGYDSPVYRDSPRGRPFNRYLYTGLSDVQDTPAQANTPQFQQRRDMPVFQCPSDNGGFWNTNTSEDSNDLVSTYVTCGSSYDVNYQFLSRWATAYQLPADPFKRMQYLQRANGFLKKQFELHVSRFVILYEDPFDPALWNNIPHRGWHRQWNRHSLLFLDAHAAYTQADPSRGNYGANWKTASGQWFNDPNDPDYRFRLTGPR